MKRGGAGVALALSAALGLASVTATASPPPLPPGARAEALSPAAIPGWAQDDHSKAFAIFARGCMADPPLRQGVPLPERLTAVCDKAKALLAAGPVDRAQAKSFFEQNFAFWLIRPEGG